MDNMSFKKGEKYQHIIKGGTWDSGKMEYMDEVRNIEVEKIIKRNGKTFVKVFWDLGMRYTIVVEKLSDKHTFIKVN